MREHLAPGENPDGTLRPGTIYMKDGEVKSVQEGQTVRVVPKGELEVEVYEEDEV